MTRSVQLVRRSASGKQLVMFPFGGGSGYSYMSMINEMARDIEIIVINPPGHIMSTGKPLETIAAMVNLYTRELRPFLKAETLFFGHSIGGLVAYEIAKELRQTLPIKKMVISSVNPPHRTEGAVDIRSNMDTELLIDKCAQLGGVPEIFRQEPVMMEGFITGLVGDLNALEHYSKGLPIHPEKLDTTATVLYSTDDYIVEGHNLNQWDQYLQLGQIVPFPGNHFYLFQDDNRKKVIEIIQQHLL
jgi:external thioesterase TEII